MTNDSQNFDMPDKLPPQSLEAEQSVLGALMLDKSAIVKVADFLQARDFYKNSHKQIYQAALDLFEKSEPIDLLSLSNRLKEKNLSEQTGGNAYLTELINSIPTASHVLSYAKIVQKKRILRDLIQTSFEIGQMGYKESEDVDTLLDSAESKIFGIAQRSLSQRFMPVKEALEGAFERIDELSKQGHGLRGVPTGFADLDNILAGLQKSDLILLASRPGFGKSALALNIAANIAIEQKMPVGLFSLEMSKDQIVDRLIASLANIDLWRLRTGRLSDKGDDNDFVRIREAMGILSKAPIYIDDAAMCNILQMKAMARRLQADKGLGLIIIDYLQLMEPRNAADSIVRQVTEISRSLKVLAKELSIPVLALSQLSRAVEQRSPQIPRLADLRESGCLAGDTLITRADTGERIKIKDLVGQTNIPVFTLDENFKIREKKISKVFCSGRKQIYKLKTRSGFEIKASANHPFRKLNSWHSLEQLSAGDRIAVPRKLSPKSVKNSLSREELILLAHLLGDGCVLSNQPIHYTSNDLQNIEIVAKTAKKLFKIKPRIVKQKNWWHVYLPSPYHLTHKKHNPIIEWFYNLGIKPVRAYKKEIPSSVFSSDEERLCLFLRHLWATDGSLSAKYLKQRKPSANIYYSSTSIKIAEGLKHLLLRLGIRSKISGVKKADYRVCYHIQIQGKKDQLKFLQKVGSYGQRGKIAHKLITYLEKIKSNPNVDVIPKEAWGQIALIKKNYNLSWRDWAKNYGIAYCGSTLFKHGISRERMTKVLDFMPALELKILADSDIFWDEIVSITPLEIEKVYDATVPETHNFIANDIVVHNSLEQDSDVVLFIYREDRYKPNTERKNIADIIIAKHRNGPVGKVELYFDDRRVSFRNLEKTHSEQ